MDTNRILQQSFKITSTKPKLWILGVVLSAGFGLHLWFAMDLASKAEEIRQLWGTLTQTSSFYILVLAVLIAVVLFLAVNYLKLVFFVWLHSNLHDIQDPECIQCVRISSKQSPAKAKHLIKRSVYAGTLGVSLITFSISTILAFTVQIYLSYFNHPLQLTLAIVISAIALTMVSLWNMFTVLGLFYFDMNIKDSSSLAVSLMVYKFKSLVELVVLLTVFFLVSISAGSVVAFLAPQSLKVALSLLPSQNLNSLTTIIAWLSWILFVVWLAINNVFFNTSLVIFYLSHAKLIKQGQRNRIMSQAG